VPSVTEQIFSAQEEQQGMLRSFIGREQELQRLHTFLGNDSPWILHVIGHGGMGKSVFLRAIKKKYHSFSVLVAPLNFAENNAGEQSSIDLLSLFSSLANAVHDRCDALAWQEFDAFCTSTRRQLMQQLSTSTDLTQNMYIGDEAAARENKLTMTLSDDPRIQELLHQASELVLEALCKLMETFKPDQLIVTIDTCEWLNESVNMGATLAIVQRMLLRLHDDLERRGKLCHVVLASNSHLSLPAIAGEEQLPFPLVGLRQAAVYQQLVRVGIQDSELCEHIYKITYGIAACVTLVCELWQNLPDDEKPRSIHYSGTFKLINIPQ